jgi:hypothetical protein
VKAVQLLRDDPRVQSVGLVNFDTQRMEEILDSGVEIVSNQVQFSLIDLRPTFLMGDSCKKHNVKLLTYGSLVSTFPTLMHLTTTLMRLCDQFDVAILFSFCRVELPGPGNLGQPEDQVWTSHVIPLYVIPIPTIMIHCYYFLMHLLM